MFGKNQQGDFCHISGAYQLPNFIIIYLYFKRSGKGEQIINYYEQTKYNKWYYTFTINVIFILLFIVLFLFANQLADKYLYSYLMS